MTANGWLQFVAFFAVLLLLMRPLGLYIARVVEGEKTFLDPVLRPVERLLYRACGIQAHQEMSWQQYSVAMLMVSFVSLLLTYLIERAQILLPWNPQHLAGVSPALAFNTAVSFTTNTNWQSYTPETTMSYFTQMVGLAYHNFLSAAIGIAVAVALVRGIVRKQSNTIGNFWVDTTRILGTPADLPGSSARTHWPGGHTKSQALYRHHHAAARHSNPGAGTRSIARSN
jgi:potassium-transporting ATPase potassium-binding subunit